MRTFGVVVDISNASGDSGLFNLLAANPLWNATQPEPPPQAADRQSVKILSRKVINPSPASVSDPDTSAAPLAPSGDQEFSGGLLGRLAAFAGIDPRNPTWPAPVPEDDEQEQPDLQALSAKLLSSGDIRDAVALYYKIEPAVGDDRRQERSLDPLSKIFDTSGKSPAYLQHRKN